MTNSLPSQDRNDYDRRKCEWGESGPAHNVGYVVSPLTRRTIVLNHTNNVPVNSMEQQKLRSL